MESDKKKPKVIIILGGPGSGKGTQGVKIEEEFEFIHLSMGDIMRVKSKQENPKVGEYNNELSSIKNSSLTHEWSLSLLMDAMKEIGWENGKFVVDGFHRKFDCYDEDFINRIDLLCVIILLPSSIDILGQRIIKRSTENTILDTFRNDDIERINKRLKIYQTETQEVIQFFKTFNEKIVFEINCDISQEEVFLNIKKILNKILN